MTLDQAQEDFFCAIARDENRTPYYMPGWHYSDQRLFELEKPKLLLMGGFALATRVKFSKQVNMKQSQLVMTRKKYSLGYKLRWRL